MRCTREKNTNKIFFIRSRDKVGGNFEKRRGQRIEIRGFDSLRAISTEYRLDRSIDIELVEKGWKKGKDGRDRDDDHDDDNDDKFLTL